jgi:hypothetical protein
MTRVRTCKIAGILLTMVCSSAAGWAAEYGLATNLPLSGAWVNYGAGMNNSFKLAVDQANASCSWGRMCDGG